MTTSEPDVRARSRRAWTRALERTATLTQEPTRTLPVLIDAWADEHEARPAIESPAATLSYRALAERTHRYARWALGEGLKPNEVVALLMGNAPDYIAIWLGLTRVGLTVALINTQLRGPLLAHPIQAAKARAVIYEGAFAAAIADARSSLPDDIRYWVHGEIEAGAPRIDEAMALLQGDALSANEASLPAIGDRALYIYTSGTTGLPKAAIVSHLRLLQWSHWFAGLIDAQPTDRMYDCLPLYHGVGGIVAPFATLAGGGTLVLRERFSASAFWRDMVDSRCTLFQYIGELCRYLLQGRPDPHETDHSLRLCCGNGLSGTTWRRFQERFRIPQILEYYAATEGSFSLYNCEGKPGSIGRIPPFLAHRLPVSLVRYDPDTELPLRNVSGQCERCDVNESGEALGQIRDGHGRVTGRFEGYADEAASERKLLHDVFESGDCWYRTGDLMRQDAEGFFYFVDRVGDTFRWKGENVSSTEVAELLMGIPGVVDAVVYGVAVPGADGRAGMAALVTGDHFDWTSFTHHVTQALPTYAQPLFVRTTEPFDVTGTFRRRKQQLAAEGFDLSRIPKGLFYWNRAQRRYESIDATAFERLRMGAIGL